MIVHPNALLDALFLWECLVKGLQKDVFHLALLVFIQITQADNVYLLAAQHQHIKIHRQNLVYQYAPLFLLFMLMFQQWSAFLNA